MATRCLVLNEWILHDLGGDSGIAEQKRAITLLQSIMDKKDQIVALRGSPWWTKAYSLYSQVDPIARIASKRLWHGIVYNDIACRILEPNELGVIPDDLVAITPPDDLYLVQTCLATDGALLVTSDQRLCAALKGNARIAVAMKAEFLQQYLE